MAKTLKHIAVLAEGGIEIKEAPKRDRFEQLMRSLMEDKKG